MTPLALNYDFGLLTLASPAPEGTAHMDIQPGSGSAATYNLMTAGYPADKPAQTMWQVDRPCALAASPAVLPIWLHRIARACCPAGGLPERAFRLRGPGVAELRV